MSKSKAEKKEKNPYISFLTMEIVILYIVLYLGDIVRGIRDFDSMLMTRYLPIGITTFLTIYLCAKSYAKKIYRSSEDNFKMYVKILPAILALIMLVFGFYSVSTNIASLKYDYRYQIATSTLDEEQVAKIEKEATKIARKSWMISSGVCLVAGLVGAFLVSDKISELVKEDEMQEPISFKSEIPPEEKDSLTPETEAPVNNIKWNL